MNDPFQNPYLKTGESTDGDGQGVIVGGTFTGFVKVGQLTSLALAAGLIFMTLVITYMTISSADGQQPVGVLPGEGDDFILPGIGVVIAFGSCMTAAIVPATMRRAAAAKFRSKGETVDLHTNDDPPITAALQELIGASHAATIVGQAMLEGAATVNLILMLLDGHLFHLGVVAVCFIGILIQTPTRGKLLATIESASLESRL